jgi:hypothetical protein
MGITFKILNRMVGLDVPVLEIMSSLPPGIEHNRLCR